MRKSLLFFAFLALGSLLSAQTLPKAVVLDSGLIYRKASFPSCHASTICQTAQGDIVVAFFGGSYEGAKDVCIWSCRYNKGAKSWTAPKCLATGKDDAGAQHPCWNPVLYRMTNDDIMLFYKTGDYIPQWVGHTIVSHDGGYTWSNPTTLKKGLLGAIKNQPFTLGRRIIAPSSTEPAWKPHFEISKNYGRTWKKVSVPCDSSIIAIQPAILQLTNDTLLALCRTKNGFLAQTYSTNKGRKWSQMRLTNIPNNNSGIDAITLKNGIHAMVYTPLGLTAGSEFGPRTPLVLALSRDARHWTTVLTLENKAGEYSYPSLIEGQDGTLHIVYTFHRTHIKYAHVALK